MTSKTKICIILALVFLSSASLLAQENFLDNSKRKSTENREQNFAPSLVLREIERGIAGGDVSSLSKFLSPQTYISLSNGISGYYSSNQAFYVLEDFFENYEIKSFQFQNINTNGNTPYATGVYKYYLKGEKDSANVFISLKKINSDWKITQITLTN